MDEPSALEMSQGVADAESALAEYAALHASGQLASVPFGSVLDLAGRASASVDVAANALGVSDEDAAGTTPDDLFSRMMAPWFSADAVASSRADAEARAEEEAAHHARNLRAVLEDAPPDTVDRAMLDAEAGDPSLLLRLKERFVFNR